MFLFVFGVMCVAAHGSEADVETKQAYTEVAGPRLTVRCWGPVADGL